MTDMPLFSFDARNDEYGASAVGGLVRHARAAATRRRPLASDDRPANAEVVRVARRLSPRDRTVAHLRAIAEVVEPRRHADARARLRTVTGPIIWATP